jgi:3-oxoacyl-[acyl-carrier-protein] synthase-3
MAVTKYASIIGWGHHVPQRVMTNEDMAQIVDTSDEWIRTRTGIGQRHMVTDGESCSTLAIRAAKEALLRAGVPAWQLDLIIVATATPDYLFPSTACLVQEALGAQHAGAFDLQAACSGFIYGLSTATQFIRAGAYRNILVIGAEALTPFIDWEDRRTCVLFGDGAGAVVVQACDKRTGLVSFVLGAQGAGKDLIMLPAGGSRAPASLDTIAARDHFIHMNGNEVYQFAVRTMSDNALEAVNKAGLTRDDIDLVIPHQANLRIIESVAKRLDMPMSKVYVNIDRFGNTSAASIPIALSEAVARGCLHDEQNVLFVAFGAGLTSAAAVIHGGHGC